MPRIVAVSPTLPEHSYQQSEITQVLAPLITRSPSQRAVLERTHGASQIDRRHTALPLERYADLGGFRASNEVFISVATELLERALRSALKDAGLVASDIDFVFFTSVTGISAPSIDGLLIGKLGLRSDLKRLPSYGLGCAGGAAGIARVADYLLGHPGEVGVVLSVELCSLTLQRDDVTMANFVATGLFGDGAAAVIIVGDDRSEPGPRVIDTRSFYYPDSAEVIGFNVGESGFEIVLTAEVATIIAEHFPGNAANFLASSDLTTTDIDTWFAHPGGPRILEAFAGALELDADALALSYASLAKVGNLSSAAVLHVLADGFAQEPGARGLLFALGPGVAAEFVLLEWAA